MKRTSEILILLFVLVLYNVPFRCEAGETNNANKLQIVVNLSTTTVRVGEWVGVKLQVVNPGPTNQYVYAWSCSWSDNWKSDNTNVVLNGQICTKNLVIPIEIKPGSAYVNNGELSIVKAARGKKMRFRMGFTPFKPTKQGGSFGRGNMLRSQDLVVNVAP